MLSHKFEVMLETPEADGLNASSAHMRIPKRVVGSVRQKDTNPFCGCYPEEDLLSSSRDRQHTGSPSSISGASLLSPIRSQAEDFRSPSEIAIRQRGQQADQQVELKVKDMYGKITVEKATEWAQHFRSPRVASQGLYSRLKPPATGGSPRAKDQSPREISGGSVQLSPRRQTVVYPTSLLAKDVLGITQSELEQRIAHYNVASPAERTVFESQMTPVEKSTFFRAMFEHRNR